MVCRSGKWSGDRLGNQASVLRFIASVAANCYNFVVSVYFWLRKKRALRYAGFSGRAVASSFKLIASQFYVQVLDLGHESRGNGGGCGETLEATCFM